MNPPDNAAVVFIDGANFYNAFVNPRGCGFRGADFNNRLDFMALGRKLVEADGFHLAGVRYYAGQLKQEGNIALYSAQLRLLDRLGRDGVVCRMGRMEKKPMEDKTARALGKWLSSLDGRGVQLDVRLRRELERLRKRTVSRMLGAWLDRRSDELPPDIYAELRKIGDRHRDNVEWKEKAVDTTLVTDLLSMAFNGEYAAAYILSFDGDYTPATRKVRETGKRMFAASPLHGSELAASVDRFIKLDRPFFADLWRDS